MLALLWTSGYVVACIFAAVLAGLAIVVIFVRLRLTARRKAAAGDSFVIGFFHPYWYVWDFEVLGFGVIVSCVLCVAVMTEVEGSGCCGAASARFRRSHRTG